MYKDLNMFAGDLTELAGDPQLINWLTTLPAQLREFMENNQHGDFSKWLKHLDKYPDTDPIISIFPHT